MVGTVGRNERLNKTANSGKGCWLKANGFVFVKEAAQRAVWRFDL
jgi:hypothetical protein